MWTDTAVTNTVPCFTSFLIPKLPQHHIQSEYLGVDFCTVNNKHVYYLYINYQLDALIIIY